jgi:acetyltransferase-like isoleucine patch superfamily enzyme
MYRCCGIHVGRDVFIFPGQLIRPGRMAFGDRVFVNGRCTFEPGQAGIDIEDDVFIAQSVIITAETHEIGPRSQRAGAVISRAVVIGRGSWIGAAATVLPGVTVAPGCVIAAGAVVTKDTQPDGLYVGVPARRLRSLA